MSACDLPLSPFTHPRIPSHRLMLPTVRVDPSYSVLKLSENTIVMASRGVFLGDLNPDKLTVEIDHHIRCNSLFTVSFVYSKFSIPAHLTPFCLLLPQKRLVRRPLPTSTDPSKTWTHYLKISPALLFSPKGMSFPFSVLQGTISRSHSSLLFLPLFFKHSAQTGHGVWRDTNRTYYPCLFWRVLWLWEPKRFCGQVLTSFITRPVNKAWGLGEVTEAFCLPEETVYASSSDIRTSCPFQGLWSLVLPQQSPRLFWGSAGASSRAHVKGNAHRGLRETQSNWQFVVLRKTTLARVRGWKIGNQWHVKTGQSN